MVVHRSALTMLVVSHVAVQQVTGWHRTTEAVMVCTAIDTSHCCPKFICFVTFPRYQRVYREHG